MIPEIKTKSFKEGSFGHAIPAVRLGTSTPVADNILFIWFSNIAKLAAGLGQSVPFIDAGFHKPLVVSAER